MFRLSDEARKWFGDLKKGTEAGSLDTLWDEYYFCFLLGAKEREIGDPGEAEVFHDEVIEDYYDQLNELLGLLITAEIERKGVPWEEEERVRRVIMKLIDASDPSKLSEDGVELMNQYAHGGFEVLNEGLPRPSSLDDFLMKYLSEYFTVN